MLPPPGATAVIFVSRRTDADEQGYQRAAAAMEAAAAAMPGYLGIVATRGADDIGITISYWRDQAAARAWRDDAAHTAVREQGRALWYDWYELAVAEIGRSYAWQRHADRAAEC